MAYLLDNNNILNNKYRIWYNKNYNDSIRNVWYVCIIKVHNEIQNSTEKKKNQQKITKLTRESLESNNYSSLSNDILIDNNNKIVVVIIQMKAIIITKKGKKNRSYFIENLNFNNDQMIKLLIIYNNYLYSLITHKEAYYHLDMDIYQHAHFQ